jgi:hypothetical protein
MKEIWHLILRLNVHIFLKAKSKTTAEWVSFSFTNELVSSRLANYRMRLEQLKSVHRVTVTSSFLKIVWSLSNRLDCWPHLIVVNDWVLNHFSAFSAYLNESRPLFWGKVRSACKVAMNSKRDNGPRLRGCDSICTSLCGWSTRKSTGA